MKESNEKKLLTIAIPVYNTSKYLVRCLSSLVFINDVELLDIILVNDGSKDESLEILNEYMNKYKSFIRIINKENGGHGSTINAALKKAKGKYFRVLDSDDWFDIDEFQAYLNELKNLDVDLVITNYTRELVYDGKSIEINYNDKILFDNIYQFDRMNLEDLEGQYFVLATTTIKTNILRESNFTLSEKCFYVDMEWVVFLIERIQTFILLDYNIYRYYIGREDQSVNFASFVRNRKDHEFVLLRLMAFYTNCKLKNKLSQNKLIYIHNIIKLMTYTHYQIYCQFTENISSAREEIILFDCELKKFDEKIYTYLDAVDFIRINRRNSFRYVSGYAYERVNKALFKEKLIRKIIFWR